VVGASPFGQASVALGRTSATERAVGIGGEGDQPDAKAAGIADEGGELRRLARPGERDHDVLRADHAEIAVARLGRMDEMRGRAGGGEGCGELAPDMAGLAHARDDDATGGAADQRDGFGEGLAQPVREGGVKGVEPGALGGDGAERRGADFVSHGGRFSTRPATISTGQAAAPAALTAP
jgi:hypothetical protein